MARDALVLGSQLTFNRVLVWVCKNFDCSDTSKYQAGQKCRGCGGEVGGLPVAFLGRWANLKRATRALAN